LRPEDGVNTATAERPSAQETALGWETELRVRFARDLVDTLKQEVPARYRRWDADEKVWRVTGVFVERAIHLVVEHFPNADLAGDGVAVVQERTPGRRLPLPPLPVPGVAPAAGADQPERDSLVICVQCPTYGQRHDRPVQVVAQASAAVAKQERPPAKPRICPACHTLKIVSFFPAEETAG
jgi:hypothetical protein